MTDIREDPRRTPGCNQQSPAGDRLGCCDHIDWDGEVVHIACVPDAIREVWIDENRFWKGHLSPRNISTLQAVLVMLPTFGPPPSDQEMVQAAQRLRKMVEEMS